MTDSMLEKLVLKFIRALTTYPVKTGQSASLLLVNAQLGVGESGR